MAKNIKRDTGRIYHQADLILRDYVAILGLLVLLVTAWFLIPIICKGIVEIGKFVTYVVACVSVSLATYATLSTYRLKIADVQRAHHAALATIFSDTEEILQESAYFRSRLQAIGNDRYDKWNIIIKDFVVLERRYDRKQDQLAFLSTQFPSSIFPKIQELYLEMLKLCMRVEKYLVPESYANIDVAKGALQDNREEILKHLKSSEEAIRDKYFKLKQDVKSLKDLDTKAISCK